MGKKKKKAKRVVIVNPDYNDDACTGIAKLGEEYFTVHVVGKEGKKPKLHLLDKYNNSVCRIRLDKPKYADDEGIKLSDQQAIDLNNYLAEAPNLNPYSLYTFTNWESLYSAWNHAVGNKPFNCDKQPDYTLLNRKDK